MWRRAVAGRQSTAGIEALDAELDARWVINRSTRRTEPIARGARRRNTLVGRKETEPERERLYLLRQVLGARENDAFSSVVMAHEHYDSPLPVYPAQLAAR